MNNIPYEPPEGYYDLPFIWTFDASNLTDGLDALNQFVYIQRGYGIFILRRIVGLSRVLRSWSGLAALEGGRYRTYDRYGNPMQSAPVYAQGAPDGLDSPGPSEVGIVPEREYPETGKIAFDLYDVLKDVPGTAQIAFQGVRRMQGTPRKPNYPYKAKTFVYQSTVIIPGNFGEVPDIIVRQQIRDYDFELYQVQLLQQNGGILRIDGAGLATLDFFAVSGSAGFTIEVLNSGAANLPLAITVVPGVSITIQSATNGAGVGTSTGAQLLALWNVTAAAVAMATLYVQNGAWLFGDATPPVAISGAAFSAVTDPIAALWVRDADRVAISSEPVIDQYLDGGPNSAYGVGAIVPPLYYPKDHLLQIDVRSLLQP